MVFSSSETDERLTSRVKDYREEVAGIEDRVRHAILRLAHLRHEIDEIEGELARRHGLAVENIPTAAG